MNHRRNRILFDSLFSLNRLVDVALSFYRIFTLETCNFYFLALSLFSPVNINFY